MRHTRVMRDEGGTIYPITIDPRIGSGDLVAPLQQLKVPATSGHLEFADAQILIRGPEDRPIPVGIEIKAIGDLLRCITDERYVGHQLSGLRQSYEAAVLLVQGAITGDARRELQVLKGANWGPISFGSRPWTYEGVIGWQLSQMFLGGVYFASTADRRGTALWLAELWKWGCKPWDSHTSHRGLYWKPLAADSENVFDEPSKETLQRMKVASSLLPAGGIGYEKARAAAEHFRGVREMIGAPAEEWAKIPGIGKTLASRIVAAIAKEER